MISNSGKTILTKFFAGQVGQIADTIAFGTGTTAVAATDTALVAETFRTTVTSISADTVNNRIVFKAVLPAGSIETVYEVAIFSGGTHGQTGTLVARDVLTTPKVTDTALPTEVEYSLGITT